jgi:CheY-like chemotaxis protein
MDIQLPGMDGLEATALLKQDDATRAIPVIALTALAMKGDEQRIRAAGCNGYIAKPMAYRPVPGRRREPAGGSREAPTELARLPARVLIVDDEERNRRVLEAMLAPEGLDLVSAGNGEEALALLAAKPPFDLILLDVVMPGMDGYEVARRVKRNPATTNIPIIMVTAHDTRDDRMLGLSAGAEDFLTKPVDRTELCLRVRNLLRLKAYGDYYDKYSQLLEGEVVTAPATWSTSATPSRRRPSCSPSRPRCSTSRTTPSSCATCAAA